MNTLVLDATTKTIVAIMSGAPATTNPDFTAAWADDNGTTFVEGASDGALNGAADVTLVAAPGASTRRVIKTITIENRDTAPVTVTVKYDNNGTQRIIAKITLAVGDTWTTDGTYDTSGAIKTATATFSGVLPVANGGTGASTASITSFNNITGYTASGATGTTSTNLVFSTSPTLVTPTLGAATATSINGLTITSSTGTLTVPNGVVLTGPASSGTAATLGNTETFTGAKTFAKVVQTVTPMAAQALDGTLGNVFTRTLAGSETFTQSGFTAGQCFIVEVTQGSGTTHTVTWFATVTWVTSGGTAPVQTTTSNGITTYGFRCTGSNTFLGYLVGTQ